MVYEIRNYHFDPARLEEYKNWARALAIPFFVDADVDVVGFWADCGIEPEVRGEPLDALGPATVTWIIRWPSREAREDTLTALLATEEWQRIFEQVPGGRVSYRRIECRFFESLTSADHDG